MKKFLFALLMLSMAFGVMATQGACNNESGLQVIKRNAFKAYKTIDEMKIKIEKEVKEFINNP